MEPAGGVAAVALNFRDVLNVMGLYPGDPGWNQTQKLGSNNSEI